MNLSDGEVSEARLEHPPSDKGDAAICCAPIAKQLGRPLPEVADVIANDMRRLPEIEEVFRSGQYVNIRFHSKELFRQALAAIRQQKGLTTSAPQRIMVEFLSPNTNKPLHLGHVRNGILGSTVANLLAAVGHEVVRANLINDRGEHICKSMLAYKQFGNSGTPESSGMKGDHFVGDWYVRYAREEARDPSIEASVHDMLRRWEMGDPETMELWETMNQWVYAGFGVTNARYGFIFDREYRESELYMLGKEQVEEGLRRDIFITDDEGAIRFPLPVEEYGTNHQGRQYQPKLLNPDGTSVYLTQDIGTAILKAEDYALDRSIYVVADEQQHHFRSLFAVLKALGYPWASSCYHLSYAMVRLPEGKMKSREGTVVDADDLADEMARLAAEIVQEKHPELPAHEVDRRAEIIGMAAIKFYLMRFNATKSILFDPQQSISFEGDTGPYCLYTYARARSILSRAAAEDLLPDDSDEFGHLVMNEERECALELLRFPLDISRAAESYAPALLANRMLSLARTFNRFYKAHIVLGNDRQLARERLALVAGVAEALRWGFSLLNIEPLDDM